MQLKAYKKEMYPEGVVPIINKSDLKYAIWELRLNLILQGITSSYIMEKVFDDFKKDDTIAIYELNKILTRRPLRCNKDTMALSRYLIEPQSTPNIRFNEKLEANIVIVMNRIESLLGEYVIIN